MEDIGTTEEIERDSIVTGLTKQAQKLEEQAEDREKKALAFALVAGPLAVGGFTTSKYGELWRGESYEMTALSILATVATFRLYITSRANRSKAKRKQVIAQELQSEEEYLEDYEEEDSEA